MEYTIENILKKVAETVDAIYVTNFEKDIYKTLKDNALFHSVLGDQGIYSEMLYKLFVKNVDKQVAEGTPYDIFLRDLKHYASNLSNRVRLRLGDQEITISLAQYKISEKETVILITQIADQDYELSLFRNQQADALKSAFLFSMKVDLNTDECGSMSMSEIDNEPMAQANIRYSEWRHFILNMFLEEDKKAFLDFTDPEYLRANLGHRVTKSMDCQMMNLEGKYIWVKLIFNRITTGNDDDFCVLFMVEDIHESQTRLMSELKKYENLANMDRLTGLMNRGSIEAAIGNAIGEERTLKTPISLLMFDIDHFKRVNDSFGHAVGDSVLKELSGIADTYLLQKGAKLGRWGGEEFVALFEGVGLDSVVEIVENLRVLFEQHHFESIGTITSSFGVIEVYENETKDEALSRMDSALYKAKELGRNRVVKG